MIKKGGIQLFPMESKWEIIIRYIWKSWCIKGPIQFKPFSFDDQIQNYSSRYFETTPGPVTIVPRILNVFVNIPAEPLADIFNKSLETSTVSRDWQTALMLYQYFEKREI